MKIIFDLPDTVNAVTNVFYALEEDGRTRIWSWTIGPKDGTEYSVVQNPDGTFGVAESIPDTEEHDEENEYEEEGENE